MFNITTLYIILALAAFAALAAGLAVLQKKTKLSLTVRVAIALAAGLGFGLGVKFIFNGEGAGPEIIKWTNVAGTGFTKLLTFVIVPLVFVSIISAIAKTTGAGRGAKKAGKIIAFLLGTTAIVAVISIVFTWLFKLSADKLIDYDPKALAPTAVTQTLLDLIPSNLFAALSGGAVLPVVFIAALIGFAYLALKKENPAAGKGFEGFIGTTYGLVSKIIEFVISLTPYGILAIIAGRTASGDLGLLRQLGIFVVAAFSAMIFVFILHLIVLWLLGVRPDVYLKRAGTALLFAFTSRSSAATLPLTVRVQRSLGVSEANADLSGALGTCIGQHGCAGVYPTMVALIAGLAQGWNVWSLGFLIPLIIYVVISSVGTAGVGGGATQVTLLVLSLLDLPVELAFILISVDFLVDMGRTALNVSDSILAGYAIGKAERDINKDVLSGKTSLDELLKNEELQKAEAADI